MTVRLENFCAKNVRQALINAIAKFYRQKKL